MRFLFYSFSPKSGGISFSVHIREVLNHLVKYGHTVVFIDGKQYQGIDKQAESTAAAPQKKTVWLKMKESAATWPLRGEIQILFLFCKEIIYLFLAFYTIIRTKPEVIYDRHGIYSGDYLLSKIFRIPYVTEVNGIVVDELRNNNSGDELSLRIIDNLEKHILLKADKIIVVTSRLKDVLCTEYGIAEEKIVIIENGANTDLFVPIDKKIVKNQLNLDEKIHYVCFSGYFYPWQGLHHLINAFPLVLKKKSDIRLILVGDGPMKAGLIEQARQINVLEKILFTGAVPYEQVPLYVNAGDICVVPKIPLVSGYSPLKLYEYMACSRPVIATRTDGFEILEMTNSGLLVNTDNPQEFADAILKLINEKDSCVRMGQNGRKYVESNRSWASVARKVAEVCQQVQKERQGQYRK